jgi:hypothetical protein
MPFGFRARCARFAGIAGHCAASDRHTRRWWIVLLEVAHEGRSRRAMVTRTVRIVLGDSEQEESHIQATVTHSIQSEAPLFIGRFLTDLPLPDRVRSQ